MRTCERCGAKNPHGAAYCGSCGAALDAGHDTVVAARPAVSSSDPTRAGGQHGPTSPSYPEPVAPGSAPRPGRGVPPVLVGVASAVAVCLVAGGVYLGLRDRDEAGAASNTAQASTPGAAPDASTPASAFVTPAPATSAAPQPAVPPLAPLGPDAAQRRAYAEDTLRSYVSQVENNALARDQMSRYFADTVDWYGASWSRDRVYDELGIVPGKARTEFLSNDTRSFTPGERYGGMEADVLTVDRVFREPGQSDIKRAGVIYTFVYDGGAAGPRIAEVRSG